VKAPALLVSMVHRFGRGRGNAGLAVTPSGSLGARGTSAPSSARVRSALAVLALAIAAFAITAAPALAAAPTVTTPVVSNVSYASAEVKSTFTTDGSGPFGATGYGIQYSTDQTNWTPVISGNTGFNGGAFTDMPFGGEIALPKGGTTYFVRAVAHAGAFGPEEEATSPLPNPSFTTLAVDPPTIPGAVEASPVFSTSATAKAMVKRPANPDPAFDVNCHFEYISDVQFEENVNVNSLPGFTGATPAPCAQNPITKDTVDAEGEEAVTAPLTGLSPATTYHLRLAAENAAPAAATKEAAATFTTAPKVAKPVVLTTGDATEVRYFTAKVSGEVQRPDGDDRALDTSCLFEYITDEQFTTTGFEGAGQTACVEATAEAPLTGTDPTPVSAELTGLKSDTTYHLRLTAANAGGTTSKDASATFATQIATPPSLAIDPPSAVTYTKAHISGSVDPEGASVDPTTSEPFPIFWQLQFSRADQPGNWQLAEAGTIAGAEAAATDPIAVAKDLEGLAIDTEYKFRLIASYADREVISPEGSFTTESVAKPIATFDPISVPTATTAKFTASVDTGAPAGPLSPEGEALYETEWHFECLPDCPDPGLSGTVKANEPSQAVSVDVIRLEPNLFYEVKLIATNGAGTTIVEQDFTTPLVTPDVQSFAGASDGEGGYALEGSVNPRNSKVTDCRIEYGTTATYPNTYKTNCLPLPSGVNEVQSIRHTVESCYGARPTGGQFKLAYRGQTTNDLPYNATLAEVETELKALSTIGPADITVTGEPDSYDVAFEGSLAQTNVPQIEPETGTIPLSYDGSFGCGGGVAVGSVGSTTVQGGNNRAKVVATHVENLTVGAHYHFRIFASNAAGSSSSADREFIPTLNPPGQDCENEAIRKENSSLALPECRAFEMVTPAAKEGYGASLLDFDGGNAVTYRSLAGNIADSGMAYGLGNYYTAVRTTTGWQTRANLNGPTGSVYDGPEGVGIGSVSGLTTSGIPVFSKDLLSSGWGLVKRPTPGGQAYLRKPDGSFSLIGLGSPFELSGGGATYFVGASADLSHVLYGPTNSTPTTWGPGVYEFVGTGNDQPRRVDLDNSGAPVSSCIGRDPETSNSVGNAKAHSISADGSTIVFTAFGGCGGANPPADEIWARVDGTTSFDVSASECTRAGADPCNAPSNPTFQSATPDGHRIFFTTTQQLLNGDTDQTNDLYACDIPSGNPAPVGTANPCSSLTEISGVATGADVQNVIAGSEDGSTVYFNAKSVLAHNPDAFGEEAVAGDNNLYVWRQDAAHPAGQTTFIAPNVGLSPGARSVQVTPDGHYLALDTATPLLPTDSDNAADVYRYDADSGQLIRASTGATGTGGNADGFAAEFAGAFITHGALEHNSHYAISDDGQKIVFNTAEALSPLDGNGGPDIYLWTPGRVSDISLGSGEQGVIDGSGENIYFQSGAVLTPGDGDQQEDVYDARVLGGFSFAEPTCSGEACQSPVSTPPAPKSRGSEQSGLGNPPQPKGCPKGKVKKHGKCVKKSSKKHSGKKHHGKKHKRASSNRGGGK
jgi:hypothetical protein